tara:strand:+ start:109 stop:1059 length:951 start_codon:yes stop_codon:yes gene_type:complete
MICIIGGSGFVGSSLISNLDKQNFLNIDKQYSKQFKNNTIISDIRNKNSIVIPAETETLVLLAAEHRDDVTPPSLYYDVNVKGTQNVLEKMDEIGVKKIIFTSSVAVYGLNKKNPDEKTVPDPFNEYGKTKLQAEKLIYDWFKRSPKDRTAIIIRPTVIFGENNRGNVYNLLRQIVNRNFLMIGSGKNKKSMAYIKNISDFILSLVNNSKLGLFEIYNYADKPDLNMNELFSEVNKLLKRKKSIFKIPLYIGIFVGYIFDLISFITRKKLLISSVRVKKFCAVTQFNSDKCKSIFNPRYSLTEGLRNTINFEFLKK